MARLEKHAADLRTRQKGLCWICKAAIPTDLRGTAVDLKANYFGGKPKVGQLGLACQSCVSRRREQPAKAKPPATKPRILGRIPRA